MWPLGGLRRHQVGKLTLGVGDKIPPGLIHLFFIILFPLPPHSLAPVCEIPKTTGKSKHWLSPKNSAKNTADFLCYNAPVSIENRPSRYISRLLSTLIFAASVQACKALPEESPTISKPTLTTELTPPGHLPKSEVILIISPSPTSTVEITPSPVLHPTSTQTPIPTPTPHPTSRLFPTPTKESEIAEISLSLWEEKSYQAIQELRKERNLPALELSSSLTEIARQRSLDMATRNYFSHTTPEGLMIFDLLDQTGNYYPYAGENLARTNLNDSQIEEVIQEIMKEFLESRGHRRNLLRPEFSLIGIGYAFSEEDNIKYITIVFTSFPE